MRKQSVMMNPSAGTYVYLKLMLIGNSYTVAVMTYSISWMLCIYDEWWNAIGRYSYEDRILLGDFKILAKKWYPCILQQDGIDCKVNYISWQDDNI